MPVRAARHTDRRQAIVVAEEGVVGRDRRIPAGTRVLVNDTLELTSPAPRGGWSLPAGLVNLVVSLPGEAQSISSSLFLAADTLYSLDLEEGGGFTVSRRAR